eukprot:4123005-Pyramimonas_sp.AAC.1
MRPLPWVHTTTPVEVRTATAGHVHLPPGRPWPRVSCAGPAALRGARKRLSVHAIERPVFL